MMIHGEISVDRLARLSRKLGATLKNSLSLYTTCVYNTHCALRFEKKCKFFGSLTVLPRRLKINVF